MSRRSRRRREESRDRSAHVPTPSLTSLLRSAEIPLLSARSLIDVEDRRSHHPLGVARAPRVISGHPARLKVKNKFSRPHMMAGFTVPGVPKKIAFKAPKKVLICVRREQRKEVLFAKRKTGRGAKSPRIRNWFSDVSCKR